VVSVTPRPHFTPEERTPGTHCTGGWVGPRAGLDTEVRGKILLPLPGIEPLSPGRPARSQTLYCLSYPAHKISVYQNIYFILRPYFFQNKYLLIQSIREPPRGCAPQFGNLYTNGKGVWFSTTRCQRTCWQHVGNKLLTFLYWWEIPFRNTHIAGRLREI
jgi:hypothetical protein